MGGHRTTERTNLRRTTNGRVHAAMSQGEEDRSMSLESKTDAPEPSGLNILCDVAAIQLGDNESSLNGQMTADGLVNVLSLIHI